MTDKWKLYHADGLKILETLKTASAAATITDPPYSSGGMTRGDRATTTNKKYSSSERRGNYADFTGDNRDQRAWAYWCTLWLSECLRITEPGGVIAMFADWWWCSMRDMDVEWCWDNCPNEILHGYDVIRKDGRCPTCHKPLTPPEPEPAGPVQIAFL